MKRNKFFMLALLVALVLVSGMSFAAAQDALPAVDLVLWTQDTDMVEIYGTLFEEWAADNAPGSTLEIQNIETEELRNQLLTAGLAGTGLPDMVHGPNDPIGVYEAAGLLQPLDELFDMTVFNDTLAAAQLGGATYGIPSSAGNHLMLMYNKSLVEAAPDTWADLFEVEASFDGTETTGFAYNLNEPFWFLPFVGGMGGSVFNEDGEFVLDSEAWVNAFQFVADLKSNGVVPQECDYNCADGLFKEGSAAIIINGDWTLASYLDVEQSPALGPDNLGLAPWPAFEDGSRPTPYTSGKFFSIPVTVSGDNLAASVAFLTWLNTDAETVLRHTVDFGRLPALTAATELPAVQEDPILAASASALATGIGMPANPELRCMWDSVRPNLEGVMALSLDAETAAEESQLAAEICLESQG